jgi:hypothetical protein
VFQVRGCVARHPSAVSGKGCVWVCPALSEQASCAQYHQLCLMLQCLDEEKYWQSRLATWSRSRVYSSSAHLKCRVVSGQYWPIGRGASSRSFPTRPLMTSHVLYGLGSSCIAASEALIHGETAWISIIAGTLHRLSCRTASGNADECEIGQSDVTGMSCPPAAQGARCVSGPLQPPPQPIWVQGSLGDQHSQLWQVALRLLFCPASHHCDSITVPYRAMATSWLLQHEDTGRR